MVSIEDEGRALLGCADIGQTYAKVLLLSTLGWGIFYQVEGRPPVTLKAGDVLFIPAGTIHAAKKVGRGNGAELATVSSKKGSRSQWCQVSAQRNDRQA